MEHNQPYYIEHVSVSEDMVKRYSRRHTLYATDNAAAYNFLDTTLRGTKYHANIVPFKRRMDGRGEYLALNAKFCRPAFWYKIFQDSVTIIIKHTWNVKSNIYFEKFLAQQRHAWI